MGSGVGGAEWAASRYGPQRNDHQVQGPDSPIVQAVLPQLLPNVANHHPRHGKKGLRVPNLHRPQKKKKKKKDRQQR